MLEVGVTFQVTIGTSLLESGTAAPSPLRAPLFSNVLGQRF
jgi:hypothetical protein